MKVRVFILGLFVALLFPATANARACSDLASAGKGATDQIVLVGPLEVGPREVVKNAVSVDGDTTIRGEVCEDVVVFAGTTVISGRIRGDVVSFASEPVHLRRGARVEGDVVYIEDDQRPQIFPGARVAGEVRKLDGTEFGQELWDALFVVGLLLLVGVAIATLVLGLFLLWLAPRAADAVMRPASESIGASIGIGLAVAIGFPIVGILVLFTVVGIPLGIIMLLALFPLYVVGSLAANWVLGRWIIREPRSRYLSYLIGWAVLTAAGFIPFLGTVAGFAATVYGLGALTVALWRARSGDGSGSGGGPTSTTPMPAPPVHPPLPPPPGA